MLMEEPNASLKKRSQMISTNINTAMRIKVGTSFSKILSLNQTLNWTTENKMEKKTART